MTEKDRPGIVAVYRARAAVSSGLMDRGPKHWRARWRDKGTRGLWWVADDRGRILGYACGNARDNVGSAFEVLWLPENDGTGLARRLFAKAFAVYRHKASVGRGMGGMAGSPALSLMREAMPPPRPPGTVFMAAVIDEEALLRDAVRVLGRRGVKGLAVRTGRHSARSSGKTLATLVTTPQILLGLLLGIRELGTELRSGDVRLTPRHGEARELAAKAFPPRKFWIQDGW